MDGVCDSAVEVLPLLFRCSALEFHGNGALFVVWPAVQRTGQVEQGIRPRHLHKVVIHLSRADFWASDLEIQPPVFQGVEVANLCAQKFAHYTPLAFLVTVTPMRASTFCAILGEMTPTSSPESMTT